MSVPLLQLVRRVAPPYPTVLAAAGVVIAMIPGTAATAIDSRTFLMVFVAPAFWTRPSTSRSMPRHGSGCRWWRWQWWA